MGVSGFLRVLDLVRDPARHVGPCRSPLVEQLVGNVVEGQDVAAIGLHPFHRQRVDFVVAGDLHHILAFVGVEMPVEFRRQFGERLPHDRALIGPQQSLGGRIDQLHPPFAIHGHDARRHARHHRLDEGTAILQLRIG